MERYLIKMYRQQNTDSQQSAGIVEEMTTGKQFVFSNREELWGILNAVKNTANKDKQTSITS